jgi:hypothetical protein
VQGTWSLTAWRGGAIKAGQDKAIYSCQQLGNFQIGLIVLTSLAPNVSPRLSMMVYLL